jgi:hypothetical protein
MLEDALRRLQTVEGPEHVLVSESSLDIMEDTEITVHNTCLEVRGEHEHQSQKEPHHLANDVLLRGLRLPRRVLRLCLQEQKPLYTLVLRHPKKKKSFFAAECKKKKNTQKNTEHRPCATLAVSKENGAGAFWADLVAAAASGAATGDAVDAGVNASRTIASSVGAVGAVSSASGEAGAGAATPAGPWARTCERVSRQ